MKKIIVALLTLIFSHTVFAAGITIGPLTNYAANADEYGVDEGCSFQYPRQKNKTMALTDIEYKHLWMNLNGVDVKFNLAKSVADDLNTDKKGSKNIKIYEYGALTVELVNTFVAPPRTKRQTMGDWRLYNVSGTFKINDGKETKIVQTKGECSY